MVQEIIAKTLLSSVKQPDPWFGLRFSMNLYRGCQHQCIYCDSRSSCYRIEDFSVIQIKVNALELLEKELSGKRIRGTIGTGAMNDPYMPIEESLRMTGRALEIIARFSFPVHIITKSDLVVRDLPQLTAINRVYAAVSFTITTADDDLARKLEPGAPSPSRRFAAMAILANAGILTGVTLMPVLPFLEDSPENITAIVSKAQEHGARYIIPSMGMTMRDGQRQFFYRQLDRHFPGMKKKYQRQFGDKYVCPAPAAARLSYLLSTRCKESGLPLQMPVWKPPPPVQLSLFPDESS